MCLIFSVLIFPFSITFLHIGVCEGVGKSAPPSAKLWLTLEAYLVDKENFETRPDANLALYDIFVLKLGLQECTQN